MYLPHDITIFLPMRASAHQLLVRHAFPPRASELVGSICSIPPYHTSTEMVTFGRSAVHFVMLWGVVTGQVWLLDGSHKWNKQANELDLWCAEYIISFGFLLCYTYILLCILILQCVRTPWHAVCTHAYACSVAAPARLAIHR